MTVVSKDPGADWSISTLSGADIVGRTLDCLRKHHALIIRSTIVPVILAAAGGFISQAAVNWGISGSGGNEIIRALLIGLSCLVGTVLSAFMNWWLTVRQLALTRFLAGASADFRESVQYAGRKKWTVIGLYMVAMSLYVSTFLLFIVIFAASAAVSYAAKALGAAVLVVMLSEVFLIALAIGVVMQIGLSWFAILAVKDDKFSELIKDGFELTFSSFWKSIGFGSLVALVVLVMYAPLGLPVAIATIVDAAVAAIGDQSGSGKNYVTSFPIIVLGQVWEAIIMMFIRPAFFLAFAFYYRSYCCRTEGLDINLRLMELRSAEFT